MARLDFDRISADYDAGRGLSREAMEVWLAALSRRVPTRGGKPVLDLGCGTGRFSAAIAQRFESQVIGVEPSQGMIREAARNCAHPAVNYVMGRAEDLPLADSTIGWAWLSTVIHHFDDLGVVADELRRAVTPGGAVIIRSWFPGRADVTHFRYFPGAKKIAETFPTLETVEELFGVAGFRLESVESVTQVSAPSLKVAGERLRLRADTTLQALSDEEFDEGMRRLEADVAAEVVPEPVRSQLDLVVLR